MTTHPCCIHCHQASPWHQQPGPHAVACRKCEGSRILSQPGGSVMAQQNSAAGGMLEAPRAPAANPHPGRGLLA